MENDTANALKLGYSEKDLESMTDWEKFNVNHERANLITVNLWTGLRRPKDGICGRNWMTYICLKRRTKQVTPLDGIMYLINEFLNWIPSGCWTEMYVGRHSYQKGTIPHFYRGQCSWCGGGFYKSIIESGGYCSVQCEEIDNRDLYIVEYEAYVHATEKHYDYLKSLEKQ